MLLRIRNLAKQILCQHLYLLLLPLSLIYTGIKPSDTKHGRGGEAAATPDKADRRGSHKTCGILPKPSDDIDIYAPQSRSQPSPTPGLAWRWVGDDAFLCFSFLFWLVFLLFCFICCFFFVRSFVRFLAAYFRGPDRHCDDI